MSLRGREKARLLQGWLWFWLDFIPLDEALITLWCQVYSEPNCALECAWMRAKETCECVPWYLKSEGVENSVIPICEMYGNACFQTVVENRCEPTMSIAGILSRKRWNRIKSRYETINAEEECGCMPDCANVNYDIEVTTTEKRFGSYCVVFWQMVYSNIWNTTYSKQVPMLYQHYLDVTKRTNAESRVREMVDRFEWVSSYT